MVSVFGKKAMIATKQFVSKQQVMLGAHGLVEFSSMIRTQYRQSKVGSLRLDRADRDLKSRCLCLRAQDQEPK